MSEYDMLCLAGNNSSAGGEDLSNILPQVELGSTATAYEPYNDTVYGGTLDVTSGELVAYLAMVQNLSTRTLKYEDANGYFWYTLQQGDDAPKGLNAKAISNRLKTDNNVSTGSAEGLFVIYANSIVRWKEKGELSQADYRTYLASNPLQMFYELATPLTYQLTPEQVSTIVGENNWWCDTGEISVLVLEPTTESVTPQPLSTTAGTNIISVTAEVSDINFDIKYLASE